MRRRSYRRGRKAFRRRGVVTRGRRRRGRKFRSYRLSRGGMRL